MWFLAGAIRIFGTNGLAITMLLPSISGWETWLLLPWPLLRADPSIWRNVQYATMSKKLAPTIPQVLTRLAEQTAAKKTIGKKLRFLQSRLRIGWGTARVAVGMAFGNHIYDQCMMAFEYKKS
jgi:hypothetical protein